MNTPILAVKLETDALRGVLRPCKVLPRPIPCPPADLIARIASER